MSMDLSVGELGKRIYFVRDSQVMLDSDLAVLYEIETFNLNKAVKRNSDLFPEDFMYQLTLAEWTSLTFQNGIAKKQPRGGRRTLPYGFTQEGVAVLSSILKSKRAREVNIAILRTFAKLRKSSETNIDLSEKVKRLEVSLNNQLAALSNNLQQVMGSVAVVFHRNPEDSLESQPDRFKHVRDENHSEVTAIQEAVAKYYRISVSDLKSVNRTASIALPRQICMYLIRLYTGYSYKKIGTILDRDHSTIIHGCATIKDNMGCKTEMAEALVAIHSQLKLEGMTQRLSL